MADDEKSKGRRRSAKFGDGRTEGLQERWREIRQLFDAALERPPEDREEFLQRACAGDESLRAEVEDLLRRAACPQPWLEGPVYEVAAELLAEESDEPARVRHIGPYRTIRELGRGGMGAVYLASRADDQYRQQVAIKLVKRGMDSEEILRRFRQERQILASLEHPSIARLLDGGMTSDGLPYLVMEYIEGTPLDVYCEERQLGLRAILQLFHGICMAVHFAHRHLVVHCDLKPGNILITPEGSCKLLDFGVAKLLGSDYIPSPFTETVAGERRLTPEYASPEQLRGERVTTASDIYSLGVLLYQLLTGMLPYRFRDVGSWPETERVLGEQAPERPSVALGRRGSRAGSEKSAKLRRQVAGDLDTIVLMALRRDPARRYASAEQMADDLRRHLEGLPVLARKDTFLYRTGKFIARHRVEVTAALLVVLSLALGLAVAMVERAKALQEQATAEDVTDFLESIFEIGDPRIYSGELRVRDLLDQMASKIPRRFAGQPAVRFRLLRTLGMGYLNRGLPDRAWPALREALEGQRRLHSASLELAKALRSMCVLLNSQERYTEAELRCREALAMRLLLLGRHAPEVAESLSDLGLVLRNRERFQQAEESYRESLALYRTISGPLPTGDDTGVRERIPRILHNLGGLLLAMGKEDEAEEHLREAERLHRGLDIGTSLYLASCLNTLGVLLRQKGDHSEAEEYLREALALQRGALEEPHIDVATTLNNLAHLRRATGDLDAAEHLALQARDQFQSLGEENKDVANTLQFLGTLHHDRGKGAEAIEFLSKALALRRRLSEPEPSRIADSLIELGRILTDLGELESAEEHLRDGLRLRKELLASDHWRISTAKALLGSCLGAAGRFEEAETLMLESARSLETRYGLEHARTRRVAARLVKLYADWGRPDLAKNWREPRSDRPPGHGSREAISEDSPSGY